MEEDQSVPSLLDVGDTTGENADVEEEPPDLNQELEQFRHQWKREINTQGKRNSPSPGDTGDNRNDVESQARQFFLIGSRLEQEGAYYEAIVYYKKAMQLVPDIESRISLVPMRSPRDRQESESSMDGSVDLDEDDEDLLNRFQKLYVDEKALCQTHTPQRVAHISALPMEVLIYIFKWVVSSELDLTALENLALVCRGFYLCARDEGLWRLACLRVWGSTCTMKKKYGCWRNMFIEKPHLQFTGCYISLMTYVRPGEKSLDNFYRPFHKVEYYRYIRFFSDGKMFMMTSPDEPQTIVPKLMHKTSVVQGMMRGYYKLLGKKVTGVLKRVKAVDTTSYSKYKRNRNQVNQNEPEQTFNVEFEVAHAGKRRNAKLVWINYYIRTCYRTGEENVADFELNQKSYPPLVFSRVKSYSTSDKPLQV